MQTEMAAQVTGANDFVAVSLNKKKHFLPHDSLMPTAAVAANVAVAIRNLKTKMKGNNFHLHFRLFYPFCFSLKGYFDICFLARRAEDGAHLFLMTRSAAPTKCNCA
jgi:hypothetical protein